MARKKNIAKLILQGISILGILSGLGCFCSVIAIILSIQRDTLTIISSLIVSIVGFVLGAYLIYNSYLMLRGRAFGLLKSIPALLALMTFGLIMPFAEDLIGSDSRETSTVIAVMIDFGYLALSVLVFILVYKICIKLLERLRMAAYGPINSETQSSLDKQ